MEVDTHISEDLDDLPRNLAIDMSELHIGRFIARGAYADVFEVNWLGCKFALKVFNSEFLPILESEMDFLTNLHHPNIAQFMGYSVQPTRCAVLMELMEMDLRGLITSRMKRRDRLWKKSSRPFTDSEALDIITQISRGMVFLHSRGVIHGDLRAKYVIAHENTYGIDIKIMDFGLSRCFSDLYFPGRVGEVGWRAPEIRGSPYPPFYEFENGTVDKKAAEVYCFAMTCYEVLTGKFPFEEELADVTVSSVKAGLRPHLPAHLNSGLVELIRQCWHTNPKLRPTFSEICENLDRIQRRSREIENKPTWFTNLPFIHNFLHKDAASASGEIAEVQIPRWTELPQIQGEHVEERTCADHEKIAPNIFRSDGLEEKHYEKAVPNLLRSDSPDREVLVSSTLEIRASEQDCVPQSMEQVQYREEVSQIGSGALEHFPAFLAINPSDLKLVKLIGEGSCSKVYEATWLGCTLAVKRFKSAFVSTLHTELCFLTKLPHPHVVRLVGFSLEPQGCWIVMELMDMDLRRLIESRLQKKHTSPSIQPFSLHEAVDIIKKIALGMKFLHSRGVTHRDLKASNVVVRRPSSSSIEVKIMDFGVSQYIGDSPAKGSGTRFWRAPEILKELDDGMVQSTSIDLQAADVYAFAMTCYEVLTGHIPFQVEEIHSHKVIRAAIIDSGHRPKLPSDINSSMEELILKCWHQEPQQRPNFSEICERLSSIQVGCSNQSLRAQVK